ncbi:MAG: leucyl-tRNA synthetase [Patescibacteria group bacterium]|nr:leucyl-tRNA synthetase [Patescibacteria group bacterium]
MNQDNNQKGNKSYKKPYYVLDMFSYPSGEGLHMGHVKVYTASDIYARHKRMKGYEVLHPTGFDSFGLPAEQYAIKNKVNPTISTKKNSDNFLRQMKDLKLSYDYDNVTSTTDPEFYKWTQWIFKQLYKKGLAYQSHEPINWCPSCKTGLANEDLEGNLCERCGSVVEKRPLRQWVLKITEYADRLIDDLDTLPEWKDWIKDLQRNWIGRSEGSEIDFKLVSQRKDLSFVERDSIGLVGYGTSIETELKNSYENKFTIFTTRADTLFGCTYTVLAPEHNLVSELIKNNIIDNRDEVLKYIAETKNKTDIDRSSEGKEKRGVRLEGVLAVNPANQEEVPVYIADYVLPDYGTGAIMAVPAHDGRDREFAEKYNIAIKEVMQNVSDDKTDSSEEVLINSEEFDGLSSEDAKNKITEKVKGKVVKKYKLRDWVFARQRYWGEPFPIVFAVNEDGSTDYNKPYLVSDVELPVKLPLVESYEPTGTGESPLADIEEFINIYGYIDDNNEFLSCDKTDKRAKIFKRESNTMPQWAGSSWYWLRFLDPHNNTEMFSRERIEKYPEVDIYLGGVEHATRHLIYGRFWYKFLYDIGIVPNIEPFKRLETVGLVLGEGGVKMSKRLGNIINPDDIIREYGVDVTRMYVMFMSPFDGSSAWNAKSLSGMKRFLDRVQSLKNKIGNPCKNVNMMDQTIKKVGEDIELLKFNTAISQLMIALNEFEENGLSLDEYQKFLQLLAPFAPVTFEKLSKDYNMEESWPEYDINKIENNQVTIAVQIAGKMRGTFEIDRDKEDEEVVSKLKEQDIYNKYITSQNIEPKKIIVVRNKIVNVVI